MYDEETITLLRAFGENVRTAREHADLTIEELIERMEKVDGKTIKRSRRTFGRNVRKSRKNVGLSVGELAARVGVSSILMHRIERGSYSCELGTCGKIAFALGISLASLFNPR